MKKLVSLLLIFALALSICSIFLISCGKEEKVYFDTHIPTFTSVTGVEIGKTKDLSGAYGLTEYIYYCDHNQAEKYIKYLKNKHGFVEQETDDEFLMLCKDDGQIDETVIVYCGKQGEVAIMPYNHK